MPASREDIFFALQRVMEADYTAELIARGLRSAQMELREAALTQLAGIASELSFYREWVQENRAAQAAYERAYEHLLIVLNTP